MFGGGTWEGGSCEEKNADFPGETGISPERVLGGGRGGWMKKHLDINLFVTLALEVCCQSAGLHSTIGGKRRGEEVRECGVRGRGDLSCNGP